MVVVEGTAAYEIAEDDAALAFFVVFEADHRHAVAFQAAAPAVVAVLFTDFADGHETEVAVGADVVVAVVALEAVEARGGVGDGVRADVAVCCDGEDLVGFE